MIVIVAKNIVKPEKVDEFLELTKPLITESNNEKGCIEYELYRDMENSNVLTFVEKWVDKAAIDAHNSSPHFESIVPTLGPLCVEPAEVTLYEALG